jgi:predicted dehydrogenase
MTQRLRLGMVGGGAGSLIGAVHRYAARLDDCYEVVAGALSSDPGRAAQSALEVRLDPSRSYSDYEEMARVEASRADGIDAVVIATPNDLHAPVATAFLNAGINVICDKPLCLSLAEALELQKVARGAGKLLAVTYTYSGYAMVRHAKYLVEAGELGDIRYVHTEFLQDWLSEPLEREGNKQAEWRNDPKRAGPAGCLGDIGTHAYHLASFVSGMLPNGIAADVVSMVPGRVLDDHVQAFMRYESGARGTLVASQVAAGEGNGLRLKIYGTKGAIAFDQERPTVLTFTPLYGNPIQLTKGKVDSPYCRHATRFAPGPEGFLEAFAQLYLDAAIQISAAKDGRPIPEEARLLTTVDDGVDGMRFIEATLESSRADGRVIAIGSNS